jgi:hypothetical protein
MTDRWRIFWHKLSQEIPRAYLVYINFNITDEELTESFAVKNVKWLNKIGYFHFENLWSHQLILASLLEQKEKPDLLNINKLLKFAQKVGAGTIKSYVLFEKLKNEETEGRNEEMEEMLFEALSVPEESEIVRDQMTEDQERRQRIEQKLLDKHKDDEEEISTEQWKNKKDVIEGIIQEVIGDKDKTQLDLLVQHQMDLLDLIVEKQDKVMDLDGLIHGQKETIKLMGDTLTENWKEILSRIKEYENIPIIPSELIDDQAEIRPRQGKLKWLDEENEEMRIREEFRRRSRSNEKNSEEANSRLKKEAKQMQLRIEKLEKERELLGIEEMMKVTKTEILNWIQNLNYEEIQEAIDEGRIKRQNYDAETVEELDYLARKGKIQWNEDLKVKTAK